MKLYDFAQAPNPRKVRTYLAEKGLTLPMETVNIAAGESHTPEFLKKNPLGAVPVLELDDGSYLTESLVIIEYLEELHPNPPMIGTSPVARARVRELERMAELGVVARVGTIFQNTAPFFAGRIKQSPEAAESARTQLAKSLTVIDQRIGQHPFVAGEHPTIADCTLFVGLEFAEFAQVAIDPACANIVRWHRAFKQRPSAQA